MFLSLIKENHRRGVVVKVEKVDHDQMTEFEIIIEEEKENVIFNRKEIKGNVISAKDTPTKAYVISYLSSKYKVPQENIDLKYIVGKPRRREFSFFALVYNEPVKGDADGEARQG